MASVIKVLQTELGYIVIGWKNYYKQLVFTLGEPIIRMII